MADKKENEKTLEMRVAELEDKLKSLHVTEDEMKTYHKVASLVGGGPAAAAPAVPQACVVNQCIHACTVVQQCIQHCVINPCTVRPCTIVQQCIQQCIIRQCIINHCINECGGGGGGLGGGGGGFGSLGG